MEIKSWKFVLLRLIIANAFPSCKVLGRCAWNGKGDTTDSSYFVSENESTDRPFGIRQCLENPGRLPLEMIEVKSGSYLGEGDIVRFEDNYR